MENNSAVQSSDASSDNESSRGSDSSSSWKTAAAAAVRDLWNRFSRHEKMDGAFYSGVELEMEEVLEDSKYYYVAFRKIPARKNKTAGRSKRN